MSTPENLIKEQRIKTDNLRSWTVVCMLVKTSFINGRHTNEKIEVSLAI